MEAKALPLSHFRARAGSPLLLSAEASSAARKGSGAPGRSRASRYDAGAPPSRAGRGGVWKRDDPEDSPRRTGMTGVPKLNPKLSTKRAGTSKVPIINFEVSHHRAVAAVRLLRADKGKAFVDLLNEKANDSGENEMGYVERTLGFSTRHLDDRDIRLVTVIVAGTVRWKRYIDYLIMSLCSEEKVFSNMEPLLLQILRIGFFEILKLNVPAYAVVDENVRLAKVALRLGAGNMVNAILRKLLLLKERDSLPLPKIEGDDRAQARALSIIYSHPVWMVRRWIRFLGKEEALKLMNWNNSDPYFSLRVNTTNGYTRDDLVNRLGDLQVHYEKSIMDEFVRIREGMQAVLQAGLLKEGMCAVQDESAGKCHNLDDIITDIHGDLRLYAKESTAKYDKVLLDAPCSGLGVLSKRADLRWNRQFEDLEELVCLQDELLDSASLLVKPGGILIYSTCSIDHEENENRVTAFVQRHPEFTPQGVQGFVPAEFITDDGLYSSSPTKHSLDGAFAARLVRSMHQDSYN
ncbi:hypothetical protein ACQJBY_044400 [Aegilops geniculata]